MRKPLTALAAIATIGVAAVAAPQQAEARFRAGPFIGGLAAGAIIGGALIGPRYGDGYYGRPYYRPHDAGAHAHRRGPPLPAMAPPRGGPRPRLPLSPPPAALPPT